MRLGIFIKQIRKMKKAWDGRTCCGKEGCMVHIRAPSLEWRRGEKIFGPQKKRARRSCGVIDHDDIQS